MNKRLKEVYDRWAVSNIDTLEKCYKKCSTEKHRGFAYCKELCGKKDGRSLRIIGHNCDTFSAGFIFENEGQKLFCYITHCRDYIIDLNTFKLVK